MTVGELAELLGGELHADPAQPVTGFATDSRDVVPGSVFLAIRGENVDGHDYAQQAIRNGASVVVAERSLDAPQIAVSNLVVALAKMAAQIRSGFDGPVIGITGSAGKTTTKEFLAAALSPLGPVLKNEGNRNTEYTSPLVWVGLEPTHRAAVIEMGMRGFGQVAHLAAFSKPMIGLVTNVGHSHIELVGSRDGIARAKSELLDALPADGCAVLWQEDDFLAPMKEHAPNGRVRTFGYSAEADCRILDYAALDWTSSVVSGTVDGHSWEARLPVVGRHLALNAAAAVLAASLAGVDPATAASCIAQAQLPPMRMEIHQVNGATVVLDTYNASPSSVCAALETIDDMPVTGRRRAVLGDMRELGEHERDAHATVGRQAATGSIDEVLFYGDAMRTAHQAAIEAGMDPTQATATTSIDDVTEFLASAHAGDATLVKGSRALELERALTPLIGEVSH